VSDRRRVCGTIRAALMDNGATHLESYIGGCYKSAYNYLRELEGAGYLRGTPQGRGLPNVYDVGTPQMRRRAARKGAAPILAVIDRADMAAEDRRWRAVYRELMGTESADRLNTQLHALAVDPAVGEELLIEALRGAADFRTITINTVRVELDKMARERPAPEEPAAPIDYFGGKYGHLIVCAGCGQRGEDCTCAGRASPVATESPSVTTASPARVERCPHCRAAPCRCPRKERRARERAAERGTPRVQRPPPCAVP